MEKKLSSLVQAMEYSVLNAAQEADRFASLSDISPLNRIDAITQGAFRAALDMLFSKPYFDLAQQQGRSHKELVHDIFSQLYEQVAREETRHKERELDAGEELTQLLMSMMKK